jgi:enamine deaminase RidA (YjgF/YER057c/UK114 family)|tara:strand:- start:1765 stop:2157 length:393 start_codon:yes stop_codon:yes gene_type:complete
VPLVPINPTEIAPPAAKYEHAVLAEDASRILHTSGIVPVKPDGTVPENISDQAEVIWQNISEILKESAMKITDITLVTTYVVPGQDLSEVMAARDETFGSHQAASTLLVVAQLAQKSWKMEISVVAISDS